MDGDWTSGNCGLPVVARIWLGDARSMLGEARTAGAGAGDGDCRILSKFPLLLVRFKIPRVRS